MINKVKSSSQNDNMITLFLDKYQISTNNLMKIEPKIPKIMAEFC